MGIQKCLVLLWLVIGCSSINSDKILHHNLPSIDTGVVNDKRWYYKNRRPEEIERPCLGLHPNARSIGARFCALLPYFDKQHANTEFLHKYRATIYKMAQGEDILDREAAFYATVLTPILFLQRYRDTWCLLERFHRALRSFKVLPTREKRSALKLLQNLRSINQKIRYFVLNLPTHPPPTRTTLTLNSTTGSYDEDVLDKKDIRYL